MRSLRLWWGQVGLLVRQVGGWLRWVWVAPRPHVVWGVLIAVVPQPLLRVAVVWGLRVAVVPQLRLWCLHTLLVAIALDALPGEFHHL